MLSPIAVGSSQHLSLDSNTLPQYGFGTDVNFNDLVSGNPFLYRVYTPRPQSSGEDADSYFVANKFVEDDSGAELSSTPPRASTYTDAVRHLDWTTRASSPFISTSFSFAWSIWEAIRRYHLNVKHDVEIAIIDAKAIADHAVTATELLMKGAPSERHKDHWRWYRFALESQDVLVWGHIPSSAVLASIPLLSILNRLPSYFLYRDIADAKESPLFKLGWDYTQKKPSYRQFCQAISDRFLRLPVEKRLRDTTAGSVRLALTLLRPYFHKHISEDFNGATSAVCNLAYVISQWPGQWWCREHPEIPDLIRCIVHMIGEEMREARRVQALADATRMQDIVGGLEQLVQAYEMRSHPRKYLEDVHLSPLPSPSPTLPPSPATSDRKQFFRLASIDIITDDMTESKSTQTVAEPIDIAYPEQQGLPIRSGLRPQNARTSVHGRKFQVVAHTASCFLTGLLVGSFLALCVLAPDRRQLAHHLT